MRQRHQRIALLSAACTALTTTIQAPAAAMSDDSRQRRRGTYSYDRRQRSTVTRHDIQASAGRSAIIGGRCEHQGGRSGLHMVKHLNLHRAFVGIADRRGSIVRLAA